jgi:hypothetical protein
MLKHARWSLVVLLLAAAPAFAQDDKKFTIKTASSEPPKEIDASVAKLLGAQSIQFFDPAGTQIAELWFCKQLSAEATPAQIKNGITFRELKETTMVAVVRFQQAWHDYRKQKVKAGVYTLRLGFQPPDGDHAGKSMYTEFLVLSAAAKDTKAELIPVKTMIEMSMKSIDASHPAAFMLFPNTKPAAAPELTSKALGNVHWVLYVACPVEAKGARATFGFGVTLVGEADE